MSIADKLRWYKRRHRWRRTNLVRRMDAVYVGNGIVLTRLASRRLMYVVGQDRSLTPCILDKGRWSSRISRLLSGILRPGMTFLDIGANYGYFSLMAADLIGPTGHVVAIEANPLLSDLLADSLQVNGFWERSSVHNVAVDEKPGSIDLFVMPRLLGSSSLTATEHGAAMWNTTLEPTTVRAQTIDEIVGDRRVDVIKIDIEGAELRAFRGAQRMLRANPQLKIVMEFSPPMLGGTDRANELLALFRSCGLSPFSILSGGRTRPVDAAQAIAMCGRQPADLYLRAA